jgi:hypothetical protein
LFRSQHVTLQVHTHKLRNSSQFPSPVRRISSPRSLTTTWDTRQDQCPRVAASFPPIPVARSGVLAR